MINYVHFNDNFLSKHLDSDVYHIGNEYYTPSAKLNSLSNQKFHNLKPNTSNYY